MAKLKFEDVEITFDPPWKPSEEVREILEAPPI